MKFTGVVRGVGGSRNCSPSFKKKLLSRGFERAANLGALMGRGGSEVGEIEVTNVREEGKREQLKGGTG